jgi:3-phenylpropionate/trans-cinnamate dioxygenase ferredoxin reductase component
MTTIAIVGTGNAGLGAALEARRLGFDGRLVMLGEEDHAPYDRPSLSKAQLAGDDLPMPMLQAPDLFERQRIDLRTGCRVEGLDLAAARLHTASGPVPYDALLLATGGRARTLHGVPGGGLALTLRGYDDALALRRKLATARGHLVVVGAGVIGLEVAATARGLGWEVTVIEAAGRPMARVLTPELASHLADLHGRAGVAIRCGTFLKGLARRGDGRIEIDLDADALVADLVVAGIGMAPDLRLAEAAGLKVDGGIVVDEFTRSSAHCVFAAGDVAALWHPRLQRRVRIESWQHAAKHGIAAARSMLGQAQAYDEVPWSWTDQYDLNLQVLGWPNDADRTLLRGRPSDGSFVALHLARGRLVGASLANQGREMRPCKSLIESGVELDEATIVDPAISLRDYAKRATQATVSA